jgi:hypothetical protein
MMKSRRASATGVAGSGYSFEAFPFTSERSASATHTKELEIDDEGYGMHPVDSASEERHGFPRVPRRPAKRDWS